MVEEHVDRAIHQRWAEDIECVFCTILQKKLPAYVLYEDERTISILGWPI